MLELKQHVLLQPILPAAHAHDRVPSASCLGFCLHTECAMWLQNLLKQAEDNNTKLISELEVAEKHCLAKEQQFSETQQQLQSLQTLHEKATKQAEEKDAKVSSM